jgi:hypothetical protein
MRTICLSICLFSLKTADEITKISGVKYHVLCIKLLEQIFKRGGTILLRRRMIIENHGTYLYLFGNYSAHMYPACDAGLFQYQEQ